MSTESPVVTDLLFQNRKTTSIREMIERVFELTDLKPSTRKTYLLSVKSFTNWVGDRPLSPTILIEFKNHLQDRTDISPKTKNLYLSSVRTVFRRMFELGILPSDYSKFVKTFVIGSKHKGPAVTDDQVSKVFRYVNKAKDERLLLIFNLLYRQGLRQKEIVDVEVEHFDESGKTLAILGKGQDDRELIHLHPETVTVFKSYLKESDLKTGYVFGSRKSKGGHLTTNMLYRIVREVHEACGIKNTPHTWRKVFTSKLIESGMNLLDVQSYTRHRSIDQLKVYFDRLSFKKTLPDYYKTFTAAGVA